MLYKKKGCSASDSQSEVRVDGNATLTKDATELDKYTEYEFQVLAFTSVGDGRKSPVKVERTKEDGMKKIINSCLFLFHLATRFNYLCYNDDDYDEQFYLE